MKWLMMVVVLVGCGGSSTGTSTGDALADGGNLHPVVAAGTLTSGTGFAPKLEDGINVAAVTIGPSTFSPLYSAVKVRFSTALPTGALPSDTTPATFDPTYGAEVWDFNYTDSIEFILTDANRTPVDPRTKVMRWHFEIRRILP